MENLNTIYSAFDESNGVSTDTRKIQKNQIYFALKGDNFDGHKFVEQAIKKGASKAVIDNPDYQGENRILVDDVLKSLQELANYHRKALDIPIIAITGSNGKTTTKKLVTEVLATEFKVNATKGNLNNHIGVPLTLLSFTHNIEIGIVEMGANHQKEIDFLCQIAEPNYGYITNFGKAHLEGFGGIEGVIKGKTELYDFLIENEGLIFINRDDDIQVEKAIDHKHYSIGESHLADCNVNFMEANPYVKVEYENVHITSQLTGAYNYKNISAGIGVGRYFGIETENIKKAIENFQPEDMRSQIIEKDEVKILLDAYNANPTSMEAALKSFKEMSSTEKIVILGDMFEIGETSAKEHRNILKLATELKFDQIYTCGQAFENAAKNFDNVEAFKELKDLKTNLQSKDFKNTFILIKGSRGMQMETLTDVF
ncbi:UDP-N-acetylmuramoyl-tripeptide--D-alanyl-D-alanine ligase [Psychroflexus aestuariivivens]|uniref:UDP-N-acetylmuramoyl-tripeptide--D-alanyl-D- alanine ligase n=1 Tax=Psychroflexus aestuariivivens TaxID=1795040 RepID=UPI000FD9E0B3|nr:UDP-N-acetylmuramoyl-tripeptide--D-alanyl-D-alanine ligase [Psychroflexus aestuariivivens]